MLSVGHTVRQSMGVAQKLVGAFHLSLSDEGTDIGGGDRDPVLGDGTDDIAANSKLSAFFFQPLFPPFKETDPK